MDETIRALGEFHRAFDCHIEEEPVLRPHGTTPVLHGIAHEMERLAQHIHAQAEIANKGGSEESRMLGIYLCRLQLMQEELSEFARALVRGSLVEALDALCDLRYVNDGSAWALGLQHVFMPAFREVHRSNMSKLRDGQPVINEAGRVVKGDWYSPADLRQFLPGKK